MPPSGIRWCFNPCWALLVLYIVVGLPFLMGQASSWSFTNRLPWLSQGAILVLSFPLVRFLIAGLVRFAIHDAMWIASASIRTFKPDVLVGFSWGGGIVCWLLASRRWSGATILLAPTFHAMASAACAPALRLPTLKSPVYAFHARGDGFCPYAQVQELDEAGYKVHVRDDSHTLDSHSSVQEIKACLLAVAEAVANPVGAGASTDAIGAAVD